MNPRRLGWIGWALLAAFAIVLLLISGCAHRALPRCPPLTWTPVETPDGRVYVLDVEDAAKLQAHINGLRAGECRSVWANEKET